MAEVGSRRRRKMKMIPPGFAGNAMGAVYYLLVTAIPRRRAKFHEVAGSVNSLTPTVALRLQL